MRLPFYSIPLKSISLLLACLAILSACSNNPPAIDQAVCSWIINYNSQNQTINQAFGVFSAVQDKDGIQDIDSIYILNDASQLLWHLSGTDLQSIDIANRHWIGNRNLKTVSGEPQPAGKLRVIAYDRAGNNAISETGLPIIDADTTKLIPRAVRRDGWLEITPMLTPESMDRELVIQDWSGAELGRFRMQAPTVKLDLISLGRKIGDVKIEIHDNLYNGSLLISSGPW